MRWRSHARIQFRGARGIRPIGLRGRHLPRQRGCGTRQNVLEAACGWSRERPPTRRQGGRQVAHWSRWQRGWIRRGCQCVRASSITCRQRVQPTPRHVHCRLVRRSCQPHRCTWDRYRHSSGTADQTTRGCSTVRLAHQIWPLPLGQFPLGIHVASR